MTPLQQLTLTHLATHEQTPCTHSGKLHLRTNKNKDIHTHGVVNPYIRHNLLSVNDYAIRYGLVAFTANTGSMLDTTSIPPAIIS